MNGGLDGLVAVVTGAASGIGAACAQALGSGGATTVGIDVVESRGVALPRVADVTDQASVDAAVAAAVQRFGGVDVVVNCAGIGAVGAAAENDDETWTRLYDVNVLGIVRMARATQEHLVRSAHASVVNIGSIAGHAGLPLRAAYSATKGAVHALTLAMAADGIADGIRVNAVAPGTVATPWVARLLDAAPDPAAARAQLEARQPLGRLGEADEIAAAVTFLASPAAGFVTGTILAIDGGMSGLRLPPSQTRV
jgi:NAD(P)-dependent dehydrogenase (short-subunit alcohol dehydrogenase family)